MAGGGSYPLSLLSQSTSSCSDRLRSSPGNDLYVNSSLAARSTMFDGLLSLHVASDGEGPAGTTGSLEEGWRWGQEQAGKERAGKKRAGKELAGYLVLDRSDSTQGSPVVLLCGRQLGGGRWWR